MKLSKMGARNEPKDLLYFQNLVPGTSDSPFIDRYKKECLDDNDPDNERRKSLLDEFPPILSFSAQQKKSFMKMKPGCVHFAAAVCSLAIMASRI